MYLWLSLIKGLDYYLFIKLINAFGTIEELYNVSNNKDLFKQKLYSNNFYLSNEIISQITNSVIKSKNQIFYDQLKNQNIEIIHVFSNNYPEKLKKIHMPPIVIFAIGNCDLLVTKNNKIFTYFQEEFSSYGKRMYKLMINYLKNDEFVSIFEENKLSDLDSKNTNYSKGKNIIILKKEVTEMFKNDDLSDIKNINLEENLIIFFCYNNYINKNNHDVFIEFLTGLMDGILIPEASYNKNIYLISSLLLEQGKDIHVIPGNIYNSTSYFSNFLLKEGANVILNTYDLGKYYEFRKYQ